MSKPIHDPDFELVRRCQSAERGERDAAFEELFARYRDRVYNLAVRLLGVPSDAEDVAQEVFVTVYRKIGEFRFSSRFFTWLYRVVCNLCTDYKRRAGNASLALIAHGAEDGRDGALEFLRDPERGPLEQLAQDELHAHAVEVALRRLSNPLREVMILRYIEDLQYGQIAEVLGCSVGTVKSRLSRAHHSLQSSLGAPM